MNTTITFFAAIGMGLEKVIKYWNGKAFTETPAVIKENLIEETAKAWAWVEENAGAVAMWPESYDYKIQKAAATHY
jgi:hypothetical protein